MPTSEVAEHTDRIAVGELGLPVGLDIDMLQLNVAGLERAATWGNIGHVTISGYRGDTTQQGYDVGGVGQDGSATAGRTASIARAKVHDLDPVHGGGMPRGYRWKAVSLRVNNAEIEERIRNDGAKWDRGLYDAQARATYMNAAVRRGMMDAARASILSDTDAPMFMSTVVLGAFAAEVAKMQGMDSAIVIAPLLAAAVTMNAIEHLLLSVHLSQSVDLPPRQKSVLLGAYFDRLALSLVTTATTRLIRAQPQS